MLILLLTEHITGFWYHCCYSTVFRDVLSKLAMA